MNDLGKKKGFTLTELAIAMTVTLVVMTLIVSLVALIVKNSQKNSRDTDTYTELTLVKAKVNTWFNKYNVLQSDGYYFEIETSNDGYPALAVYKRLDEPIDDVTSERIAKMYFDEARGELITSDTASVLSLSYVKHVIFTDIDGASSDKDAVKVTIECEETSFVMLLVKDGAL